MTCYLGMLKGQMTGAASISWHQIRGKYCAVLGKIGSVFKEFISNKPCCWRDGRGLEGRVGADKRMEHPKML